jgi:DNA-binding transcriptional LysR family regulator
MRQIEYFLAVARHLNFTEAAKSLYVSQPSISKQISLFEHEIGVPLFIRTKRSVRLTPAGTVLFKELKDIHEHIDAAIAKALRPDLGEDTSIAIGCLEAMEIGVFLRRAINDFKSQYPGVKVVLERHSFRALREKLLHGDLDLIFTLSFEIDSLRGVLFDYIQKTKPCILMSASHPMAAKEHLDLSDMRNENFVFISREESPMAFDGTIELCRRHGFTPNIVKQLPNVESLLLCIESGLGISLFDATIRLYNSEHFRIFELEDNSVDVVMAWKKENLNHAVSLFINTTLQKLQLDAPSR